MQFRLIPSLYVQLSAGTLWKGSTVPVTGSGEVGSGPQAAKTIIWLLLGVRSRPSANNNNSLINRGSESNGEQRGGVKVFISCCVV